MMAAYGDEFNPVYCPDCGALQTSAVCDCRFVAPGYCRYCGASLNFVGRCPMGCESECAKCGVPLRAPQTVCRDCLETP